jgi:hypothetical protein
MAFKTAQTEAYNAPGYDVISAVTCTGGRRRDLVALVPFLCLSTTAEQHGIDTIGTCYVVTLASMPGYEWS